jgi:hypothetical protein
MNLEDLVEAYVAEQRIDRLRDYVARGRPLAGLSEQTLSTQWVELYRAVKALEQEHRHSELTDLRSEYDLRGVEPPMHLVSEQAAIFTERFNRQSREFQPAPGEMERFEEKLAELQERLGQPKN